MLILGVKVIHPAAKPPSKMTHGSAGFDLYAAENVEIPAAQCDADGYVEVGRGLVPTGIEVELPQGQFEYRGGGWVD